MHKRRRWWIFRLGRCTCGLTWPCVDLALEKVRRQYPERFGDLSQWNGPTAAHPVQHRGRHAA
ncbi:hypothetical protein AB0M20_40830 [Actinoplanes sp. NPDC051633]|uniref:hypothetical protein n=1 Tax=Actinoplanes sp. NPDC051633 TaxID=3155670 RepID=UPI0034225E1F